ncbi:MAG: hypothetical protein HYZ28_27980 [Myxococcales bacterium]|nr:hypothetical protein [Myxococcales bacterium]
MSAAAFSTALLLLLGGAKPGEYTERSLCDLWAGAHCHATKCLKDAKERCTAVSSRCRGATRHVVSRSRAERTAACAKALLQSSCGGPTPSECADVTAAY